MSISTAIALRRSVRGFKSNPVSQDIIARILETAACSPSAMNIQPWEMIVVTGTILGEIKNRNAALLKSGVKPFPDLPCRPYTKPYEGMYRQRQVELAVQIYQILEISREDKEKRFKWMERGFRFYEAPVAIIILTDRTIDDSPVILSLGAFCQSICLAALDYGLGTCIEDQGVLFPDELRKLLKIPESRRIVVVIALGYPDHDFPVNKLVPHRESLDKITSWYGF